PERAIQRVCLRDGPREAVEDEAIPAVRLFEPLADDADHELVRHELACVHEGLGLLAELGAVTHRLAQDVPGGDLRYAEVRVELLGLRALPGTRRPQQNQIHRNVSPKGSRRLPCSSRLQRSLRGNAEAAADARAAGTRKALVVAADEVTFDLL